MGRIWRKAVDGARPWARDNIAFAGIMAIAPTLALFAYDRGSAIDWRVVCLTVYLYLFAFVLYCVYRLVVAYFGVQSEDREMAVGESRLLFTFEAQALELVAQLESVYFHWNSAGEVLIRPLDENETEPTKLQMELRDFKNTYGKHLQRVEIDIPRFFSKALLGGYPSNREYPEVLADLKEHAQLLGDIAVDVYRTRRVI